MSGSGRKSAYRKTITDEVLFGEPEPTEGEVIVRVVALRGSNMFEVETENGMVALARLPTKFRKLIWIKRGDFLIVSQAIDDYVTCEGREGAVKFNIEHILKKDQIKNLKKKSLWPAAFSEENLSLRPTNHHGPQEKRTASPIVGGGEHEDEEYDDSSDDNDDDLFVNRNRMMPSDSEAEEEEEEDQELEMQEQAEEEEKRGSERDEESAPPQST